MHGSPAKHSYAWLPRKHDYRTVSHTDGQTDAGQSDPYVQLCFAGDTIIFVHTILNYRSYSGLEGKCRKLSKQHRWACESTCTNFQDDLTVILEHPKICVFPKILGKVRHFKICVFTKFLKWWLLNRLGLKHAWHGFYYCNKRCFMYRVVKYRFS